MNNQIEWAKQYIAYRDKQKAENTDQGFYQSVVPAPEGLYSLAKAILADNEVQDGV